MIKDGYTWQERFRKKERLKELRHKYMAENDNAQRELDAARSKPRFRISEVASVPSFSSLDGPPCIVYIDMDDTIVQFTNAFEGAVARNPAIQFPQSQFGFFESLEPMDGAIEGIAWMRADDRIEPYILTAPSIRNPWSYTGKRIWVENHLGLDFCQRLIICPNKSLLRGHCLIDDCLGGNGQDDFEGDFIHYGSKEYPNWESVVAYLDEAADWLP